MDQILHKELFFVRATTHTIILGDTSLEQAGLQYLSVMSKS